MLHESSLRVDAVESVAITATDVLFVSAIMWSATCCDGLVLRGQVHFLIVVVSHKPKVDG